MECLPSFQTQAMEEELIHEPTEWDILCGKEKECLRHAGSRRFRQVVEHHQPEYHKATTKKEKMAITQKVYNDLANSAARFLKYNADAKGWEEITHVAVRDKISHALRCIRPKKNKKSNNRKQKRNPSKAVMKKKQEQQQLLFASMGTPNPMDTSSTVTEYTEVSSSEFSTSDASLWSPTIVTDVLTSPEPWVDSSMIDAEGEVSDSTLAPSPVHGSANHHLYCSPVSPSDVASDFASRLIPEEAGTAGTACASSEAAAAFPHGETKNDIGAAKEDMPVSSTGVSMQSASTLQPSDGMEASDVPGENAEGQHQAPISHHDTTAEDYPLEPLLSSELSKFRLLKAMRSSTAAYNEEKKKPSASYLGIGNLVPIGEIYKAMVNNDDFKVVCNCPSSKKCWLNSCCWMLNYSGS